MQPVKLLISSASLYAARIARSMEEVHAAQTLRFEVFNLELNEGLEQSYATGRDEDQFDAVCDHLIVEHLPSHQVVGNLSPANRTERAQKSGLLLRTGI